MVPCYIMSLRLYFPIYRRRPNGNCTSKLFTRHCSSRHILRSGPLSLCLVNRSSIRYYRRLRPSIPPILRVHPWQHRSKNSLYDYVCRSQYNVLPSALPRPVRNATTLFWLSRCIYNLKYDFLNGLFHLINSSHVNSFHSVRSFRIQARSGHSRTNHN